MSYRWGVASRAVAAILGGYGLAALVAASCAVGLPSSRAEATLIGMLLSFVVHAAAVMWAFATRTAVQAWVGILVPAVILSALLFALRHGGAA